MFQILYIGHNSTSQNLLVTTKYVKLNIGYNNETSEVMWITNFPGLQIENSLNRNTLPVSLVLHVNDVKSFSLLL